MFVRIGFGVGVFSLCLTLYLIHYILTVPSQNIFTKLWTAILLPVCGVTSVVCYDMYRKKCSPFHNTRSSLNHYIAVTGLSWVGWHMKRKLDTKTKDIKATQTEMLLSRLKENVNTVYGEKYKFCEMKSREDFVRLHPLTRIKHYEPYINRMMEGEEKVLTDKQPIIFAVTSGTSGKSSELPMTGKQRLNFFLQGVSISYSCMLKAFPDSYSMLKSLKFFYTPKWRTSKAGIPVGPNSSSPSNSKSLLNLYSTPIAGFDILSEPEALYVHLLFGLRDRAIGMLEANFSSIIYSSFRALEVHWKDLADDLEKGRVNPNLRIDSEIREKLDALLTPDPERAEEVRNAFKTGRCGIAKQLWPHCSVVLGGDTGAFDLHAKALRETYCKGIPLYSPMYAASEGLLGVNIWPTSLPSRYMLAPESMFFEFIPIEKCEEDQPETLFLEQVEKDKDYELVITNAGGLYRYRFGDVVKVVDYYNQCPVVEFMYRQGQFLNVRAEKTSESAFYNALTEASKKWGDVKVVDYCCAESVLEDKGQDGVKKYSPYYLVFLELETPNSTLSTNDKAFIDETLCSQSYVYGSFRKKGSIDPMKVFIVKPGTFKELREFTIATTTASSNQYKVPRVLKRREALDLVMKNVID